MSNIDLGAGGEKLAVAFLKKNKFEILEVNYKTEIGEIDIIAADKKTICFIEVKTRTTDTKGLPREAVNIFKQRKIIHVASGYIKRRMLTNRQTRFDVIEILDGEITHIQNAFSL